MKSLNKIGYILWDRPEDDSRLLDTIERTNLQLQRKLTTVLFAVGGVGLMTDVCVAIIAGRKAGLVLLVMSVVAVLIASSRAYTLRLYALIGRLTVQNKCHD